MTSVAQKPQAVSTYDWETGTTTLNIPAMDAGQRWRCAISQATEAARKRFPHSTDRIESAYELVHAGHVTLHPTTQSTTAATVRSSAGERVYQVNGTCECPDATHTAPEGWCKHKIAVAILRKALRLVTAWKAAKTPVTVQPEALDTHAVEAVTEEPEAVTVEAGEVESGKAKVESEAGSELSTFAIALSPCPVLEAEAVTAKAPAVTVPAQFVTTIKGKPFVQFAGLLTVATSQGLLSLTEQVTHVTDTYVLAEGRAEFADGRVFVGVGDSAPDNVGEMVKPHWRRLAGTRAMARALRNALNIPMVAVEELA